MNMKSVHDSQLNKHFMLLLLLLLLTFCPLATGWRLCNTSNRRHMSNVRPHPTAEAAGSSSSSAR
jgi:hypothetical protein